MSTSADMRPGRNGGKLKPGGTNPGAGRPTKLPALDVLMDKIMGEEKDGITAAEAILKKLRAMASQGNLRAAEILLDRGYGKPKQALEHSGSVSFPTPAIYLSHPDAETQPEAD